VDGLTLTIIGHERKIAAHIFKRPVEQSDRIIFKSLPLKTVVIIVLLSWPFCVQYTL